MDGQAGSKGVVEAVVPYGYGSAAAAAAAAAAGGLGVQAAAAARAAEEAEAAAELGLHPHRWDEWGNGVLPPQVGTGQKGWDRWRCWSCTHTGKGYIRDGMPLVGMYHVMRVRKGLTSE